MDKDKIRSVPHFAHQDKQDGCKKRKHTGPREKNIWIVLQAGRRKCLSAIQNPEAMDFAR